MFDTVIFFGVKQMKASQSASKAQRYLSRIGDIAKPVGSRTFFVDDHVHHRNHRRQTDQAKLLGLSQKNGMGTQTHVFLILL